MSKKVKKFLKQLSLSELKRLMKRKKLDFPKNWSKTDFDFLALNTFEREINQILEKK